MNSRIITLRPGSQIHTGNADWSRLGVRKVYVDNLVLPFTVLLVRFHFFCVSSSFSILYSDSASASQAKSLPLRLFTTHNQTLENVQSAKYLGITITDNMDWSQHVSEISSKTTKTLGFLRRNLAFAPKSTKEVAYKNLVWPKLEYAAPIWSPHSKLPINQTEKVQRTAARWTCKRL